jgi:hypothetical protein
VKSPLRRLFERIVRVSSAADPDAALADAGIDSWEDPASALGDAERGGLVDPREGAVIKMASFASGFSRPVDYPNGWPFLADRESVYSEASCGDDTVRILVWPEPAAVPAACDDIREQLEETGWSYWEIPEGSAGRVGAYPYFLGWFRLGERHRLLSLGEHEGTPALLLTEAHPEQLWPSLG